MYLLEIFNQPGSIPALRFLPDRTACLLSLLLPIDTGYLKCAGVVLYNLVVTVLAGTALYRWLSLTLIFVTGATPGCLVTCACCSLRNDETEPEREERTEGLETSGGTW